METSSATAPLNENLQYYQAAAAFLGIDAKIIDLRSNSTGLLLTKDNKHCVVSNDSPGLYPQAVRWSSHVTADKVLCHELLKGSGFMTTDGQRLTEFTREDNDHSLPSLFPLILKPNKGARGENVWFVADPDSLKRIITAAHIKADEYIVEPYLDHAEYRVLFINGEIAALYAKHRPVVVGDGTSTLQSLIAALPERATDDDWTGHEMLQHNLKANTVLPMGKEFAYRVTKRITQKSRLIADIPDSVTSWAQRVAAVFGTPVIGIDLFAPAGLHKSEAFIIIEVNSNPGLRDLPLITGNNEAAIAIFIAILKDFYQI